MQITGVMRNAIRRTTHDERSLDAEPTRAAALWRRRASLFRSLYIIVLARGQTRRLPQLNGVCREQDATSQRFAHIEIDDDRVEKK